MDKDLSGGGRSRELTTDSGEHSMQTMAIRPLAFQLRTRGNGGCRECSDYERAAGVKHKVLRPGYVFNGAVIRAMSCLISGCSGEQ
ncbi:hypothetical protein D9M71_775120 [compost metagenome]